MRCHEVRALCGAYLDSELDTKTSIEIEQHLGNCAKCHAFFEGERRVDARIRNALQAGAKDELLWSRIEAHVTGLADAPAAKRSWWKGGGFAAAASVALAITLIAWPKPSPNDLVAAVAVDHAKYLAGNMPSQFVDEPAPEVLELTHGRLDREAFSILPPAASFKSEGKRLCKLNGVPVAWMMGNSGGTPVSVIVLKREELAGFPALEQRFAEGHRIACFKAGEYEFGARRVDDHVICIVGDLPRPQIKSLLASVSPAL